MFPSSSLDDQLNCIRTHAVSFSNRNETIFVAIRDVLGSDSSNQFGIQFSPPLPNSLPRLESSFGHTISRVVLSCTCFNMVRVETRWIVARMQSTRFGPMTVVIEKCDSVAGNHMPITAFFTGNLDVAVTSRISHHRSLGKRPNQAFVWICPQNSLF